MESARPATHDDVERIAELMSAAHRAVAGVRGGSLWLDREAPSPADLAAAVDDPERCLVAGVWAEIVFGYALAHVEVLPSGYRLLRVVDLQVDDGARGVGVGERIMEQLLEFATARACDGIDSHALPGDRATKNYFERHGLVARSIIVHRSLGPADG